MNVADDSFEILKKIYNDCDPYESLVPRTDPRWVDLDAYQPSVRGESMVRRVSGDILLSEGHTYHLFAGYPGSGKTTELNHLAADMEDRDYLVVRVRAEDWLDLSQPITVMGILMPIAAEIERSVRALEAQPPERSWLQRTVSVLQTTEAELQQVKVDARITSAIFGVRQAPELWRQMERAYHERPSALVDEVHSFIADAGERLERAAGKHGIIVLLDDLEKLEGSRGREMEVLHSAEKVFVEHAESLRIPCHAVYAVPPALHFITPRLGTLYNGGLVLLPMVKVRQRDWLPDAAGQRALRDLILKRVPEPRLLLGPGWSAHLDTIILASGGYVRDLLGMVKECARRRFSTPTTDEHELAAMVEAVVSRWRDDYARNLRLEDIDWLRHIDKNHNPSVPNDEAVPRLAKLFNRQIVLCYHNGGDWYGLHPCFRESPPVIRHLGPPHDVQP